VQRSSPFRRRLAATAIVASLPLPILVTGLTAWSHLTLASCAVFIVAALVAGPIAWPGKQRVGSVTICICAAVTLVLGGFVEVFGPAFVLCTHDGSRDYLSTGGAFIAVAGFVLPYALGSAWAVDDEERVLWAWPVVIVLTLALGVAILALVEGGPHHCET
jgi:hypothetical protein